MLLIDFLWSKRFPFYVELSKAAQTFLNPFLFVCIVELQNKYYSSNNFNWVYEVVSGVNLNRIKSRFSTEYLLSPLDCLFKCTL